MPINPEKLLESLQAHKTIVMKVKTTEEYSQAREEAVSALSELALAFREMDFTQAYHNQHPDKIAKHLVESSRAGEIPLVTIKNESDMAIWGLFTSFILYYKELSSEKYGPILITDAFLPTPVTRGDMFTVFDYTRRPE